MGLDMYLTQRVWVGANYEYRKVQGTIALTEGEKNKPIEIPVNKVSYIALAVGYWRKANQIHAWFVNACQDGKDECQLTHVEYAQLQKLLELCKNTLKRKSKKAAKENLPTLEGFFFGDTEIDEFYWEDLKRTIEIIDSLDPDGDYYYQSSW